MNKNKNTNKTPKSSKSVKTFREKRKKNPNYNSISNKPSLNEKTKNSIKNINLNDNNGARKIIELYEKL